MNRTYPFISAIALAFQGPMILPTAAAAQGYSPAVDFCKVDVPKNPPFVLGDCLGFVTNFNNDSEGLVRFICDYLSVTDEQLFYGSYEDVPECIRDRASDLPPPPYN